MKFNRTQEFLFHFFKEDLNDNQFKDLVFILNKFFRIRIDENVKYDTERDQDLEKLKNAIVILINKYFKLSFSHSSDVRIKFWNKREMQLRDLYKELNQPANYNKEEIILKTKLILDEINLINKIEMEIK